MKRRILSGVALAAAAFLGGCEKQLTVENPNSGNTERVLGTPADAENLIGTYWKRQVSGLYGSITNVEAIANMYSLQTYSSLANECQGQHTPFLGSINDNTPGNGCSGQNARVYTYMAEVNRVAASFIGKLDADLNLGSPARNARARAWANWLNGLALGYMALWYDSAAIITSTTSPEDPGVLVGHKAIADSAYAAFQRAIDETNKTVTGDNGFPIPNAWMPSPTTWSKAEFIKLVRSYRARIRANMARTPAERGAADWAAIIADAQNGITGDFLITTSTTVGPSLSWRSQYESFGTWHQMPPFFIGMADNSGSYAAWIAQNLGDRGSSSGFFMTTADLRFPQGSDRPAQRADFAITQCQTASTPCKRYFVNRAGGDQYVGYGFGWSQYDFVRFHSWNIAGDATARNGNTPTMTLPEMDLLQAEGLYRQGNYAGAAALINKTRTKNGLPAITAFDATSAVPGGTACVPRVPVAPFNVVGCGNMWDALKYEKRIETAFVHHGVWFLEGRGWGDLPIDTPLYWPTPFGDLQARGVAVSAIYGTGPGPGNAPGSATTTKGVYGW
jgi:hypothetical protein